MTYRQDHVTIYPTEPMTLQPLYQTHQEFAVGDNLRDTALEVLYELGLTRPDVVAELVPELVELALGLDYRSARVREFLTRLDQTVLESRLKPIVQRFVAGGPERDASEFWGLIELLDKATLVALRDEVVDAARRSPDMDTRIMSQSWIDQLKGKS